VSTSPVSPTYAEHGVVIHHATVFAYGTATTCGRTEIPKPSTNDWRGVSCEACKALRPERLRVLAEADACPAYRAMHRRTIRGAATLPLPVPIVGCANRGGWCRCKIVNA
jgi:hypothetical protein